MLCRLLAVIVLSFGTLSGAIAMGKKPPPTKDTTAPSVPANLTAKNLQTNAVDIGLAWNASTDNVAVTGYHVDRNGATIATTASPGYTDTKAAPHANVTYSVSAFDAAGNESAQSKTAMLFSGGPVSTGGTGDFTFTPQHTFFMAPTGNDACDGTSTNIGSSGACAWATADHAGLVCGDVILAKAGAYSAFTISHSPSSCPSSSLGIDGNGQIYVAAVVCAGTFVGACTISGMANITGTCSSTRYGSIFIAANNWAIIGFDNTTTIGGNNAFAFGFGSINTNQTLHHVAFVNNISRTSGAGFVAADCSTNQSVPGDGPDQWAAVGNISYNSANLGGGICSAQIVDVGPANNNSDSGTHVYIAGNYIFTGQETCASDIEGVMLDTLDAHGYTGQTVIKDNIIYNNSRNGIQLFYQSNNYSQPNIYIYQNTIYGDGQGPDSGFTEGEINIQACNTSNGCGGSATPNNFGWVTSITNNIAYHSVATASGGALYYAGSKFGAANYIAGWDTNITWGSTGNENILFGVTQPTCGFTCGSGNHFIYNAGAVNGTNTITDPSFKNVSHLISSNAGSPSCGSFTNAAACAGWNQSSQTVTSLSIIDDISATAGGMTGKGYQAPKSCATDSLYPTWLKGVVYLQASGWTAGATITEKAGLVSKPCNM